MKRQTDSWEALVPLLLYLINCRCGTALFLSSLLFSSSLLNAHANCWIWSSSCLMLR